MPFDNSPSEVPQTDTGLVPFTRDVFSLPSLIAWLEKQPADGTFNFGDCDGVCCIDLYLAAHGYRVGPTDPDRAYTRMFDAGLTIHAAGNTTFGEVLADALAALGMGR